MKLAAESVSVSVQYEQHTKFNSLLFTLDVTKTETGTRDKWAA